MPKSPREWGPEEKQIATDFHRTFDETDHGKRVLARMRADMYDVPVGTSRLANGSRVACSNDEMRTLEGTRDAFALILGYLEAYDRLVKEG